MVHVERFPFRAEHLVWETDIWKDNSEIVPQLDTSIGDTMQKHLSDFAVPTKPMTSVKFWQNFNKNNGKDYELVLFVINCSFLLVKMVYSSSKPQFVHVIPILN